MTQIRNAAHDRHNVNNILIKYHFDWQLNSSFAHEVDSTNGAELKRMYCNIRQTRSETERQRKKEKGGTSHAFV